MGVLNALRSGIDPPPSFFFKRHIQLVFVYGFSGVVRVELGRVLNSIHIHIFSEVRFLFWVVHDEFLNFGETFEEMWVKLDNVQFVVRVSSVTNN